MSKSTISPVFRSGSSTTNTISSSSTESSSTESPEDVDSFTDDKLRLPSSLYPEKVNHPSKLQGKVAGKTYQKTSIIKRRNMYKGKRYSYRGGVEHFNQGVLHNYSNARCPFVLTKMCTIVTGRGERKLSKTFAEKTQIKIEQDYARTLCKKKPKRYIVERFQHIKNLLQNEIFN